MSIADTVRSFADLGPDWDSYGADKLPAEVIERAALVAELLDRRPQAAPGSDGSIQFEWHLGLNSFILTIPPLPDPISFFLVVGPDAVEAIGHAAP